MISVTIHKPFISIIDKIEIKTIVRIVLSELAIDPAKAVNVVIGDDRLLHDLNLNYLGKDRPTDVLSFEATEVDPNTGETNLGDILISYPTAERQANQAGHPVRNEILLLLTHGLLHLAGFDHDTPTSKKEMWQKQSTLLGKMNVEINRISGDEDFHD